MIIRRSAGSSAWRSRGRGREHLPSQPVDPRIANRLLARVRDYAVSRASGVIDPDVADEALRVFEVDDLGLDKVDRVLESIIDKFGGGPVGLSTLAIAVGEEPETVEDAYEPFLLQSGLIKRTPRGRMATARAYTHLGQEPPRRLSGDAALASSFDAGRVLQVSTPESAVAQVAIEPRHDSRLLDTDMSDHRFLDLPHCSGPGIWSWSTRPGCGQPGSRATEATRAEGSSCWSSKPVPTACGRRWSGHRGDCDQGSRSCWKGLRLWWRVPRRDWSWST